MFVQKIHKKTKNKTYTSTYLVENYRENGKVKHRLISNLSKWPDELVKNFENLLKGEKFNFDSDLELSNYKSFGAIKVIEQIAKKLGIKQALGYSRQAKLTMIQIAGRIITQGSRHYIANEWSKLQAIEEIFGIKDFSHNDLYDNLTWLSQNQEKIEAKILKNRRKNSSLDTIFLYDVSSSYLEGTQNELAEYGYNRDKKKGKKQIVIGLLTDSCGYPVSIEVFKGNTSDTTTVSNQLIKLKDRFGVKRVVIVGDKGMIKSTQIQEITSNNYSWHYLTTITKSQIKTLIKQNILQLDLFAEKICEIELDDVRYIVRRNPDRADALAVNRDAKIQKIRDLIEEQNTYLKAHKRAKTEVALRKIEEKISKLNLKKIISAKITQRNIELIVDELAKTEAAELDGCYVVKTNVPVTELDTQSAHDRYKDLAKVEFAFRTMKTTLEEIRPIYVRKEQTTRGHVFVVMLAYMIIKYITDKLQECNFSRKYIFECLDKINYIQYKYENKIINVTPKNISEDQNKILNILKIKLDKA